MDIFKFKFNLTHIIKIEQIQLQKYFRIVMKLTARILTLFLL